MIKTKRIVGEILYEVTKRIKFIRITINNITHKFMSIWINPFRLLLLEVWHINHLFICFQVWIHSKCKEKFIQNILWLDDIQKDLFIFDGIIQRYSMQVF